MSWGSIIVDMSFTISMDTIIEYTVLRPPVSRRHPGLKPSRKLFFCERKTVGQRTLSDGAIIRFQHYLITHYSGRYLAVTVGFEFTTSQFLSVVLAYTIRRCACAALLPRLCRKSGPHATQLPTASRRSYIYYN